MNLSFPSMLSMMQGGFFNLENTMTMFSHSHWPGLLFRRVDSMEEALNTGGVALFCRATGSWVINVGRTARQAKKLGLEGKMVVPTAVKPFPVHNPVPGKPGEQRPQLHTRYAVNETAHRDVFAAGDDVWVLAMLTKANDGHLIRRGTADLIVDVDFQAPFYIEGEAAAYGGTYAIQKAVNRAASWKFVDRYSGYLAITEYTSEQKYFADRKSAVVSVVDSKVQKYVAKAHDEVVDAMSADSLMPSWRFALHISGDGKWTLEEPVRYSNGPGSIRLLSNTVVASSNTGGEASVTFQRVVKTTCLVNETFPCH